jgi:hypothetical protein
MSMSEGSDKFPLSSHKKQKRKRSEQSEQQKQQLFVSKSNEKSTNPKKNKKQHKNKNNMVRGDASIDRTVSSSMDGINAKALANQLSERVFNGITIPQNKDTGFLNATLMCQAAGKMWNHYKAQAILPTTKIGRRIACVASKLCREQNTDLSTFSTTDPTAVIFTRRGRGNHAWVHPLVAIDLAMWISDEFYLEVIQWTGRFLSGDLDTVRVAIANRDTIHGTTTLVTTTTVPPGSMSSVDHADLHDSMTQQHTATVRAQHSQRFGHSDEVKDNLTDTTDAWPVDFGDDVSMFTTIVPPSTGAVVQSQWRRLPTRPPPTTQPTAPEAQTQGVVYFIRAGDTDHVKVGYTEDLPTRLSTLQTANACPLVIECQFLTSEFVAMEKVLHRCLDIAGRHIRGEWYTIPKGYAYHALIHEAMAAIV